MLKLDEFLQKFNCDARIVGNHVYEITGIATNELEDYLQKHGIKYSYFTANNKQHGDYNKKCIEFSWFDL